MYGGHTYDLVSIGAHSGSADSGHWFAFRLIDSLWWLCNDGDVRLCPAALQPASGRGGQLRDVIACINSKGAVESMLGYARQIPAPPVAAANDSSAACAGLSPAQPTYVTPLGLGSQVASRRLSLSLSRNRQLGTQQTPTQ